MPREMSTPGTRQVVVQDLEERISARLVVNGGEQTITTGGVDISTPSGGVISTGNAATLSGSLATLNALWSESSFPIANGYIATWNLEWNDGGGLMNHSMGFLEVVRRRFCSMMIDDDLTDLHPYLVLPSGLTTYKSFRELAWRRISRTIRSRFNLYPGNLFYPGDLFDCQMSFALAAYHMGNSFDAQGSEDWEKSQYYERQGAAELEAVMSNLAVDLNDDGFIEDAEKHVFLGGVSLVR